MNLRAIDSHPNERRSHTVGVLAVMLLMTACQAPRDQVVVDAAISPADSAVEPNVDAPATDASGDTAAPLEIVDTEKPKDSPIKWIDHGPSGPTPAPKIVLRWVRNYPSEQVHMLEKGVLWGLSMLGAQLPADNKPKLWQWLDDTRFLLDLSAAGFDRTALEALAVVVQDLQASGEYAVHGAIDAGRFIALTLNSSHHYYAITGAHETAAAFREAHGFPGDVAWVLNSTVAHNHRLLEGVRPTSIADIAWIAGEGNGSLPKGTFSAVEEEAIDTLPNGQLRFAVYGSDGGLIAVSSPDFSASGRPAKCMFCHEGTLLPSFTKEPPLHPSKMSKARFHKLIGQGNAALKAHRATLHPLIHYDVLTDHSYLEKLYVAFLEPSAQRIADEWEVPLAALQPLLNGKGTHVDTRYHVFFSDLYLRHELDPLAPYSVVPVVDSKWGGGANEPNLFAP